MVCSDDLETLGAAARSYGVDHPRPGWAEQDPRQWEEALPAAIAGALAAAGLPPEAVTAVGVAGQLDGCVPTTSAGDPVGPCLIWMDRRAADCVPGDVADLQARTGVVPDPGHMAAKARWLAIHRPGADRYHQPVSYLVARLTGEHVFDHGLASTTMVYDLGAGDYADDLLAAFALDRASLPRIDDARAVAGALSRRGAELTGLPPGIAVCVGTGDDFATPLGAGMSEPGPVACVLGTAEVVGALHPAPVVDPGALVETHAYPGGAYLIENPGWLAGGAMAWLARVVGADIATLDAEAAAVPAGADGLVFVPALSGAMAPKWISAARGAFHGLTPAHGRGHLARAVMESCAFAARDVVDRLRALSVRADELLCLGGGARSAAWVQIHADACGVPARVAVRVDTCPMGAAALAAMSQGADPDRVTAALRRTRPPVAVDDAGRDALDRGYRAYRRLFDRLEPLWTE